MARLSEREKELVLAYRAQGTPNSVIMRRFDITYTQLAEITGIPFEYEPNQYFHDHNDDFSPGFDNQRNRKDKHPQRKRGSE